ncbi:hypothetical protein [Paraburkholderia nemoris]|uniref:hypothetical protein n=1 Tax=Paraburkholderia nemoris TaxID=2793076 RepID=UPI001AFFB900|nr:hypothetical protein [Paraburkholderia nemoris]CAE6839590.1 hypothetical protein LMG22931_07185 [Paraburkholderia nemoris]
MKLLAELQKQVGRLGALRRAWFTSFNMDIEFVETYVLPALIGANTPRTRLEYELLQHQLTQNHIDVRIFCDPRFVETRRIKRTCIPVHGIRAQRIEQWFSKDSLFHPKVIYLEDIDGKRIVGAGSANLTVSGWGRNLEAFRFLDITTRENYREVRAFFEHLCRAADIDCTLDNRRRFPGEQESWRFVHSFQFDTFVSQLFADATESELAVWSPYLPHDLAAFIEQLRVASGIADLRVHLVTDRIEGKYLRTQWNEALAKMLAAGDVVFHDAPLEREPAPDLYHAKLWKIRGRLALGSWNFTGPGSNSKCDENGKWHLDNNVEAGFIIDDRHSWRDACGKQFVAGKDDCASAELLQKEELDVTGLPPFDLHVSFDWRSHAYLFVGKWLEGVAQNTYSVRLPGVTDAVPLIWTKKGELTQPGRLTVDDRALLRDRVFRVIEEGKETQRGLISELHTDARRVQAFDTLQDLLEALIQGDDPQSLEDLPFRAPPDDMDAFPDDSVGSVSHEGALDDNAISTRSGISYFRLFQSMHAYQRKVASLEKIEDLDRFAFSLPGCLLELVDKTRAQIECNDRPMFTWFLAYEVRALCEFALKHRNRLTGNQARRDPAYEAVPKTRWAELKLPSPTLPKGIAPEYVEYVREHCRYD